MQCHGSAYLHSLCPYYNLHALAEYQTRVIGVSEIEIHSSLLHKSILQQWILGYVFKLLYVTTVYDIVQQASAFCIARHSQP
jgi:hypothetical protein